MSQLSRPNWYRRMPDDVATSLLVIEDDLAVAQTLREGLASRGFKVYHASTLASGRRLRANLNADAIILDITLPDGSGLDFAVALRTEGSDIPILMLTAKDTVHDRISGFQHGADDYLCKPFDIDELTVRISAILRRTRTGARHTLTYANITLDLITRHVTRETIDSPLSAREAELLAYLIRHRDEVIPRERMLQEVWGDEAEDDSNVLNVYINYLRNKIEAGLYPRLIHTVRGVGYMLSEREPDEFL